MSETKHTPLPLPREVGGHVWLIELPGQPITIADKAMAFNLVNRFNSFAQLETDSKKLREPAACNAGHKSNLPVALWGCPVCTQLLRDELNRLRPKVEGLVAMIVEGKLKKGLSEDDPFYLDALEAKAYEVEAALKGSQPADTNSPEVRKARGAM